MTRKFVTSLNTRVLDVVIAKKILAWDEGLRIKLLNGNIHIAKKRKKLGKKSRKFKAIQNVSH